MKDINVLLTEDISDTAVDTFKAAGFTSVTKLAYAPDHEELFERLKDTHLLGIRSRTQLTGEILKTSSPLLAVGCFCIGTNQVDLNVAASQGIAVFNAPFSNTRSVAELAISSIIALMRGIPEKNAQAHSGKWVKSAKNSHEVRKKKLGIVGYGNIGSQLSVLASALGLHVYYYDPEVRLSHGNARAVTSLDELYKISDIISYHVPDLPETRGMVNKKALSKMKKGVYIINYARGSVIGIDALVAMLQSGHVAGAAIDVFPAEPAHAKEEFVSPLRGLPNVLLTPHIGGSTVEAQEGIGTEVAEKLINYTSYGTSSNSVNLPETSLPRHQSAHRITNVHENIGGMLSQINTLFYDINVVGQALQTRGDVGYVIMDVEASSRPAAYQSALDELPGSIKTRIL